MPYGSVNFSITLPSELYDKVNEYCRKSELKRSTVIAQALKDFLEKIEKGEKK